MLDDNHNSYSSLDDEMETARKSESDDVYRSPNVTGDFDSLQFETTTPESISSLNDDNRYHEETSAELAVPQRLNRSDTAGSDGENESEVRNSGTTFGLSGLALSVLSLFIMPILLGAAGIVLGFVARRRGANTLGAWAIGVGAVSIIVGIFILPFF
ncbi:hypothetical protein BCI9360_03390 [Bacillus sp. CECT 9360]|nr:hypothetical protein BCI9360_03390 [Bacillus sp. CECT 9360]